MELLTQTQAAKKFNISRQSIFNKTKLKKIPTWLVLVPGRKSLMVDPAADAFIEFANGIKKKRKDSSQEDPLIPVPDPENPENTPDPVDPEVEAMRKKSQKAGYADNILKMDLSRYKVEEARLNMRKKAGELIEWEFAEFLFLGYMNRINQEKLTFPKKLTPKINNLVAAQIIRTFSLDDILTKEQLKKVRNDLRLSAAGMTKELVKLIIREEETILHEVRVSQEKEVKQWHEDRE